MIRVACMALVTAFASTAAAQTPSVRVDSGDDSVMVVVEGIRLAANAQARAWDDRVEVAIASDVAFKSRRVRDKTVKRVELRGRTAPRFSVQLRHGRRTTRLMAKTATLRATDNGFRIVLPRKPRKVLKARAAAAAAAKAKAEAENKPQTTAAVARPSASPSAKTTTKPPTMAAGPSPAATTDLLRVPPKKAPVPAEPRAGGDKSNKAIAGATGSSGSSSTVSSLALTFVLFVCGGALIWWARRRRPKHGADNSLSVVASHNLGPKAKIVLVDAGERELLIAVGDAGPKLLTQWKRRRPKRVDDFLAANDNDQDALDDLDDIGLGSLDRAPSFVGQSVASGSSTRLTPPSPAVAGIVRLRQESIPPINDAVATGDIDADAEWARELFMATRGAR